MEFRMTIVGVGGVGGVLAGPLLRKYGGAVSLVARGARAEQLRQNGITLRSDLYGDSRRVEGGDQVDGHEGVRI